MHHSTDRIIHTTAFVTPVVGHWLEREIAQWVHPMSERSYHGATSRSYHGATSRSHHLEVNVSLQTERRCTEDVVIYIHIIWMSKSVVNVVEVMGKKKTVQLEERRAENVTRKDILNVCATVQMVKADLQDVGTDEEREFFLDAVITDNTKPWTTKLNIQGTDVQF